MTARGRYGNAKYTGEEQGNATARLLRGPTASLAKPAQVGPDRPPDASESTVGGRRRRRRVRGSCQKLAAPRAASARSRLNMAGRGALGRSAWATSAACCALAHRFAAAGAALPLPPTLSGGGTPPSTSMRPSRARAIPLSPAFATALNVVLWQGLQGPAHEVPEPRDQGRPKVMLITVDRGRGIRG